jgi:precorrin-4 methylase
MPLISVVGAGMLPQRDLTLGAHKVLRLASRVLYSDFPGAAEWLAAIGVRDARDVTAQYQDGAVDRANYSGLLELVVRSARQAGDVAYLVPGNPWLGNTVTQALARYVLQTTDMRLEIVPGVSSLDTTLADLSVDALERGCVVVDANRLLLFRYDLDPRLGVLIYHGSAVGTTRTDHRTPWKTNQIQLLQEFLCGARSPETPFAAVCSAPAGQEAARITRGTIGDMASHAQEIDYGTTIYVPGKQDVGHEDIHREFLLTLLATSEESA